MEDDMYVIACLYIIFLCQYNTQAVVDTRSVYDTEMVLFDCANGKLKEENIIPHIWKVEENAQFRWHQPEYQQSSAAHGYFFR